MKFVMTQAVCPEGMRLLEGKADVYVADHGEPDQYMDEMKEADAFIVRIGKCDKNVIENSPTLRVIGRTGVGYDSVDVEAATRAGIPVVITPGANNRSVAEHAVGMMFALAKNFVEAHNELKNGNWKIRDANKAFELQGKKVGFIGLGVKAPTPEWGLMLNEGRAYMAAAPWLMIFPGLAILIVVVVFNLFGDSLRDVLDPRDE